MNLMGLWAQLTHKASAFAESSARTSFSGKIGPIKSPRMLTPNQGLVPPEGGPRGTYSVIRQIPLTEP